MPPAQAGRPGRRPRGGRPARLRADQLMPSRRPRPAARSKKHDWLPLGVAIAPSIVALAAFGFTYQQVKAANTQLVINQQGQVTDRYNAAITNLGSTSIEIRLGGIYALRRLMHDSPPDQPTIVAVLSAFVRDQSPSTV